MDWTNPTTYIALMAASGFLWGVVAFILKVGKWIESKDKLESSFNKFVDEVRTNIKELRTDVKELLRRSSPDAGEGVAEGKSPLQLNDLGRSISEALGAAAWAREQAPELRAQVEGMIPYDIQEFCMDFTWKDAHFSDELMRQMKCYAYDEVVDIIRIKEVFGFELRNALLEILSD